MNEAHGVKKYGADKIAFLGLFILALLLAHFITFSRHTLPSKAGSKAIAEIKAAGISSLLSDRNRQDFFLIKDAKGHTIGFTMDTLAESETETQLNIQATGYSYIRGLYVQEQVTFFQSDNSFDEFVWKSEIVGRAGRKDTRIILSRDGTVTVTSFGREQKEQSYKPDSTPIPGVLFDLLLSQMLHSGYKKIIVGIINSDGRTFNSVISGIKAEDAALPRTGAEYILNVEFQDIRRFSEQVYFDHQKQITKILLRQERLYILERTGMENVLKEFPERADYILQKNWRQEQKQPPKGGQLNKV